MTMKNALGLQPRQRRQLQAMLGGGLIGMRRTAFPNKIFNRMVQIRQPFHYWIFM